MYMNIYEQSVTNKIFEVDGHSISLDALLVNRFSDIVCPITESFLRFQIKVFGNGDVNDDIISRKISLDMAEELHGYQ